MLSANKGLTPHGGTKIQMANNYMIIPTYDTVILPDVEYQLGTTRFSDEERSRIKIDGNRAILLPLKIEHDKEDVTAEDFFPLGVLAEIVAINDLPGGTRIHVKARQKVSITDITITESMIEGIAVAVVPAVTNQGTDKQQQCAFGLVEVGDSICPEL